MNVLPSAEVFMLLALKSAALGALGIGLHSVLKRQPARWRAHYLVSCLVLLLALPVLSLLLPPLELPGGLLPAAAVQAAPDRLGGARSSAHSLSASEKPSATAAPRPMSSIPVSSIPVSSISMAESRRETAAKSPPEAYIGGERLWRVPGALGAGSLWVWGLCAGALLSRLIASLFALQRLRRHATPLERRLEHPQLPAGAEVVEAQIRSPVTFGVLRPVIVLPPSWRTWSRERLAVVLRHEMEHVAQHDWATRLVGDLAVSLYWFNPFSWIARNRLRLEQEVSCDLAVIESGLVGPRAYGHHLIDLAEQLGNPRCADLAVPMAKNSTLEQRLMRMTEKTTTARTPLALFAFLVLLTSVPLVAALRQQQPASSELRRALSELAEFEARIAPLEREMQESEKLMKPHLDRLESKAREIEQAVATSQVESESRQNLERELEAKARRMQELVRPLEAQARSLESELARAQADAAGEMEVMRAQAEEYARAALQAANRSEADRREAEQALEMKRRELRQRREDLQARLEPMVRQMKELREQQSEASRRQMQQLNAQMNELAQRHQQLAEARQRAVEPLQEEIEAIHRQMEVARESFEASHRAFSEAHSQDAEVFGRLEDAQQQELSQRLAQRLGKAPGEQALNELNRAIDWRITRSRVRLRASAAELSEILSRNYGSSSAAEIEAAVQELLALDIDR